MKTASHSKSYLLLLLILGLALGPAGWAADSTEKPASKQEAPTSPPAPVAPAAPANMGAPAKAQSGDEDGVGEAAAEDGVEESASVEPETEDHGPRRPRHPHGSGNREHVSVGSDSRLAAGEKAEAVISILGSSTSAGEVDDAVVSILGSSRVTGGTVGDSVVSVLGNTYINGLVKGEVVTILGDVELGPQAVVNGEIVCIGGQVIRAEGSVAKGNVQHVSLVGNHFDFSKLAAWFSECLRYGRPLAFDGRVMWAWVIALGLLGFYALIVLIAPRAVEQCVETLEQRPGYSLLTALLTLLLTPVTFILLALTIAIVIGIVLIPIFSLGLFFAALFGKIVMLAWLGRRFTRLLGDGPLAHPVFGVLIGGVVVLGLYTIPYAGFIIYKLLGILGLGVVVYTIIRLAGANRAAKVAATPAAPPPAVAPGSAGDMPPPGPPLVSAAPPVISAATLPRVGFWIRLGASVLDCILLGILVGMTSSIFHGWLTPGGSFPFWYAVYCVVMWATKGTTIGGIICGLKVVRLDDRPLDWSVALVRGLGGFLSFAVAGLGFIWVAFDDERQSWHDKIAGTTIVRVPKGTALL